MATKKQKRAAGLAKREEFLEKVQAQGLAAQKEDKALRDRQSLLVQQAASRTSEHYESLLAEEITRNAEHFGQVVRRCEQDDLPLSRAMIVDAWKNYRASIKGSPHLKAANEAYWRGYTEDVREKDVQR